MGAIFSKCVIWSNISYNLHIPVHLQFQNVEEK